LRLAKVKAALSNAPTRPQAAASDSCDVHDVYFNGNVLAFILEVCTMVSQAMVEKFEAINITGTFVAWCL
jgi:hypothetical protein